MPAQRCSDCGEWVDGHDVHMFDGLEVYCRDCAGRHLMICCECSVRYAHAGLGVCSRCAERVIREEAHVWCSAAA